jgi:hypothetical protein
MRRIISFTIAQDEPLFEPIWINYYSKVGDVIVYDPRTTPGLPLKLGDQESETQQATFVTEAIRHLLGAGYDVVLCPDIDEFLIPSNGQSLKEFCETFEENYAQAQGYQIVHQFNKEPPVNFSDPLSERSVSFVSETYTKNIITKIPLVYGVGRHYSYIPEMEDYEYRIKEINPNLDLVHLRFVDLECDFEHWNKRANRCPNMIRFTRGEFISMYSTGIEPVAKWVLWEGQALPLKPHWRDLLRLPDLFDGIVWRKDMREILQRIKAERICEVGVRAGDHLRELLAPCVKEAVAVDIWEETGKRSENDECFSQEELDEQCVAVGKIDRRIIIDRTPSILASQHYEDGWFDFVYIDADHTESAIAADLRVWWPKVRRGGVLAGHDFYDITAICKDGSLLVFGIVGAVKQFVSENGLEIFTDSDGDWFIRK